MKRRNFLTDSIGICSLAAVSGVSSSCVENQSRHQVKQHPLEGIEREKIKITDVKVTLLSCPVPPKDQWYLDWVPERYKCWKTDSVLIEVFTDVGITGIGGSTQYGVPHKIVKYVNDVIKPALIGHNPFDVEFLTCGVSVRGA